MRWKQIVPESPDSIRLRCPLALQPLAGTTRAVAARRPTAAPRPSRGRAGASLPANRQMMELIEKKRPTIRGAISPPCSPHRCRTPRYQTAILLSARRERPAIHIDEPAAPAAPRMNVRAEDLFGRSPVHHEQMG